MHLLIKSPWSSPASDAFVVTTADVSFSPLQESTKFQAEVAQILRAICLCVTWPQTEIHRVVLSVYWGVPIPPCPLSCRVPPGA